MSTTKNEHNPEIELKPCPFCGGNASYYSRFDVKCGICGAEINSLNPTETWNRRITPPTDTTGSGREGETPETDALWVKLMAALKKAGLHPMDANEAFALLKPFRQLERQRDAALKALSDIEAHWRDQSNNPLWSQEGREICQMVADEISERRAAIDSAQRQEGSKAD